MSTKTSALLGLGVGLVTSGFYFMAAGRSLDFDSSVTVGAFVKTGSLLDPLRRQLALNNHPLFSIIEHVLWSLGLRTETWLRVPPILFGVLTIVVITAWCAKSFGLVPGLSAGLIVASNPMFAGLARELRGYSLLSLCAVSSTLLLWRLVERSARRIPMWMPVVYMTLVAAGIATHLYGWVVLVVHVGIVIARKEFGATWFARWFIAGTLGSLVYVPTIHTVLNTRNTRTFYATFPREVVVPLLGQARAAIAVLGALVLLALWMARKRPSAVGGVAAMLAFLAFVWIVVQPEFLVFRYLVWLVPGVAVAAALVVARYRIAVVLVAIAVIAMVAHDWPNWTATEIPTSETAAVVNAARSEGMRVCGLLHTAVGVLAYTRQPAKVMTIVQTARCDLAVGFYVVPQVDRLERAIFPYSWKIPGLIPGYVYSRKPEAVVLTAQHVRVPLDANPRTWPS